MDKTTLGDRMKLYEQSVGPTVVQRMPVIIRVDGKAFHTWTKQAIVQPEGETGPSHAMHEAMISTAASLCEEVQNTVVAYTQSDEISLLLRDYDTTETQQWFGGNVQKIVSVAAAIATDAFGDATENFAPSTSRAVFDARVFNVPKEDVANYFVWRQQDATRNSINYIARQFFSHKQLHGKNKNDVQEMLWQQFAVNWNDYLPWQKRGSCVMDKYDIFPEQRRNEILFSRYAEDWETPIFTQDRHYIERFVYMDDK